MTFVHINKIYLSIFFILNISGGECFQSSLTDSLQSLKLTVEVVVLTK